MNKIDLTNEEKVVIDKTSSKGNQNKWHINNLWYKMDSSGYEGLAEVLASRILEKSNVKNFVSYNFVKINLYGKEYNGCFSKEMKKEGDTLVPLERLLREAYHIETAKELYKIFDVKEAINFVCDKLEKLNIKDVGLNLSNILSLDALCLNQDRHTNNISFIIDKNNNIKFSPIYDNGDSFLSDLYTFPDNKPVEDLLKRISSKPFSASFDKQLNAVNDICPNTFVTNFSGYDLYNFCNEAKQYYSKDIVERIKDIAIIQLEKYRDVLVSISDKDTIKNEYNRSELEQNIFNPTKSAFNKNIAQSLNIDKEERV